MLFVNWGWRANNKFGDPILSAQSQSDRAWILLAEQPQQRRPMRAITPPAVVAGARSVVAMTPGVIVPHFGLRNIREGVRQGGWQHRRFWSEEDTAKLRAGVKKHRVGRWAVILRNTDFDQDWTAVNLKDRWRNIGPQEKSSSGSGGAPRQRVREHSSVVTAAARPAWEEQRIRERHREAGELLLGYPRREYPRFPTANELTRAENLSTGSARDILRWWECGHCKRRGIALYGQRLPHPRGPCPTCHGSDWQPKKKRLGSKKPPHTPIPMPRLPPLEVD